MSSPIVAVSKSWAMGYVEMWNRFWFTPRLPHTLAALRILTGLMLLYSHLVLASALTSFLGDHAWINNEIARKLHDGAFGLADYGRSYLWHISNPLLLWAHHGLAIVVTLAFAVGLFTRLTGPAAWFLQLMYLHRLTGALFGLDQIVTYSAMYLMFSPCGSCFSLDAWLRKRLAGRLETSKLLRWLLPAAEPSLAANVCTRLFQVHLCVIYLFGGLAKARGESWWDGTAMWYSVGNYEYQSIDMTWIANYPRLFSALSHGTLFWETFYCVLIWPKFTRPFVLAMAVAIHGGIAAFLGMITFGLMMIAANMVFIRPETLLRLTGRREFEVVSESVCEPPEPVQRKEADPEQDFDDEFSLEELGLEDFGLDSNASDILKRDVDASASGILDNLTQREAALARRENRLREASRTLREKKERLNQNLEKYSERVARLKEREAKIKELIDRRRKSKQQSTSENDGDSAPDDGDGERADLV